MSQVINTNIASLNAQRNLNESQGGLQTSLERLSSGLRINSAGDDAAGLAISERFSAQISGLEQAQRNSNDGISFAQTAEGGLDEIGNLLQRVRELSVQAANDTNSNSDRQALDQEVQQAIEEVNRIAASTQFNDQNVLDGNLEELIFQVGANAGQTIGVDGADSRGSQLGAVLTQTGAGDAVSLGETEVDRVAGGEASLDFSDVAFDEGDLTGSVEIDGRTIDIEIAQADLDGEDSETQMGLIADAIRDGIADDSVLDADDFEVTSNPSLNTVSVTNLTTDSVDFGADLRTGDGEEVNFNNEDVDGAEAETGTVDVSAGGINTNDGDFDQGGAENPVTVESFEVTLGGVTVDLADAAGIDGQQFDDSNDLAGALQAAIRDASELQDIDGIENFGVDGDTGTSDNITFENTTLEEFSLDSLQLDQDGTTGDDFNLTLDAAAAQETELDLAAENADFDISTGATGTITIDGVGEFEFSVEEGSSITDLAAAIEATVQEEAGNEQISVSGSGDELTITNAGLEQFDFDLDIEDGQNQVTAETDLSSAEIETLNDRFAAGETVTFEADVNGTAVAIEDASSLNDVIGQINAESAETGVQANLTADGNDIVFSGERGQDFSVSLAADVDGEQVVDVELNADAEADGRSLNDLGVISRDAANETLVAVDFAIDQVNGLRADLGATQNRFESTIANLSVGSENLSAARSRIVDADFASETADLTRAQILQQAGTSVLAQANQIPQNVVSLLQ
ncbi:hypothetical protein HC341_11135 [Aquisalimonas sp. 2447]|uniref:flagellin N-terminal helical domain-containing protein n=1 Tax=Aquisalimonas sp. 2447 TaxID=2740807 RepID=UPI0014327275|nr:flagellin [Aquisalimonas sp. 2447]QIT55712.1 hypothetical protein HC341_11135 [Aquisalimonas sp. 2447]